MVDKTSSHSWVSRYVYKCGIDIPIYILRYFVLPNDKTMSCSDKMLESAVASVQWGNYTSI